MRQGRIELRGGTWSDAIVEKTQRNAIVNRDLALSVVFFSRSNKVLRGWGEHHRVAKTLLVIVAVLRGIHSAHAQLAHVRFEGRSGLGLSGGARSVLTHFRLEPPGLLVLLNSASLPAVIASREFAQPPPAARTPARQAEGLQGSSSTIRLFA